MALLRLRDRSANHPPELSSKGQGAWMSVWCHCWPQLHPLVDLNN